MPSSPLPFLLLTVAGWMTRDQRLVTEYLLGRRCDTSACPQTVFRALLEFTCRTFGISRRVATVWVTIPACVAPATRASDDGVRRVYRWAVSSTRVVETTADDVCRRRDTPAELLATSGRPPS
jgi:hypothetical protein